MVEKQIVEQPYRVEWSAEVAQGLSRALNDIGVNKARQEVEAGLAQLWKLPHSSYVVTRVEEDEQGSILVLVAGEGKNFDVGLVWCKKLAKNNNIKRIRLHAGYKGIIRMSEKNGFIFQEAIMCCEV